MTSNVFREFFLNERLDFKDLNEDTLVVFDTNTLLNIYRYSNDTRERLIKAIKAIQKNVWMPYQVGLEFNLNRRGVIDKLKNEQHILKGNISKDIKKSINTLNQYINSVSLKSSDAKGKKKEIVDFIEVETTKFSNALYSRIEELFKMLDYEEDLASEIAGIFDGNIGNCYTQEELDKKLEDAKVRYDRKIPPGYEDADKKESGIPEITYYNGIQFEKQYGDLIVWHQILDRACDPKIKKVVLITDDNKEDWWYIYGGKTIGPRAELKNEMLRIADADLYMFNANSYLNNFSDSEETKDLISTEIIISTTSEADENKDKLSRLIWDSIKNKDKIKSNKDNHHSNNTDNKPDFYSIFEKLAKKDKLLSELTEIDKQIKEERTKMNEINDLIEMLNEDDSTSSDESSNLELETLFDNKFELQRKLSRLKRLRNHKRLEYQNLES